MSKLKPTEIYTSHFFVYSTSFYQKKIEIEDSLRHNISRNVQKPYKEDIKNE